MTPNSDKVAVLLIITFILLILSVFSMRVYRQENRHKEEIIQMQKFQLEHLEPSCDQ